jgi:peptide/nickel transport system permease protein
MNRYMLNRILYSIFALFFVSVGVFSMIHLQPGNPYQHMVAEDSDPAFMEKRMTEMGYHDPLPIQYLKWIRESIRGNLGYSIKYFTPVTDILWQRLKNTLLLAVSSFFFTALCSVFFGMISAYKKDGVFDILMTFITFILLSVPAFFLGLLLIKYFSYDFKLLPPSGMITAGTNYSGFTYIVDLIKHLIMPFLVLTAINSASTIGYVRAVGIRALAQPYIQMGVARGAGKMRILWKHAFSNALVPIITILCMRLPALISGTVIIEAIFVWPGVGSMMQEAVLNSDYPLIMGATMMLSFIVIIMNLVSDILCILVNPKMRRGMGGIS